MSGEIISIETAQRIAKLEQENKRLLELCMYALIYDTKIYYHELAIDTEKDLIDIIKSNMEDDTQTLKEKLKRYWNNETR